MLSNSRLEVLPAEVRLNIYHYLGFPVDNRISSYDLRPEFSSRNVFLKQRNLTWELDYTVAYSHYTVEGVSESTEAPSEDMLRNNSQFNLSGVQCSTTLMAVSTFFTDELHQILYEKSRLTISTDAFRTLAESISDGHYVPGPCPHFLKINKAYCLRYIRHLCLEQGIATYVRARPGIPLGRRASEATVLRFSDSVALLFEACPILQTLEFDPGSTDVYQLSAVARKLFATKLTASILLLTTLERLIWIPASSSTNQTNKNTIKLSNKYHKRQVQIAHWVEDWIR